MMLSLYECLKVVGLQRHHDRLSSAGVCHVVHLSALTIEEFSLLGISSVEDRSRLFELIQVLQSLDLESPGNEEDYNHSASTSDGGYTVMGKDRGQLCRDISDDEEEGENNSYAGLLSVCSRLQFSNKSPHLTDSVDVYSSDHRRANPALGKEPATALPVQVYPVCVCRENNTCSNCSTHQHRKEKHVYPGVARGSYFSHHSNYELPSMPGLAPRTRVSPKTKDFGQKDKNKVFRKKNICKETDRIGSVGFLRNPTPIYEAKTLASNNRQTGMQRIYVCVRKRPLTQAERRRREADVVTTPGRGCLIVHENKEAVDLTHYILQHEFHFDNVFGDESSNEDVYKRTTYPLVQHMLNGGKATCFAYGQTGAGKTHTMLGSCPTWPGLYALAVHDIFQHLSTTRTCSSQQVYVSFFEIYCGQLYDLLDHRKRLFAREDGQKVVHISGLRYIKVTSIKSLMEVISQGTEERTQGVSGANPFSSRSHALLQIQLRHSTQQTAGRMWFVDLAGSERASDTKNPNKQSRMEGAEINQSLLALKECIRSLDREQTHTPFRQSKLTQVLKDSFVGDSMTCMIANISPGHTATEHTLNTLRYADRVKELKGQRGRRRRRTGSSPKHSLSNSKTSNSRVGTRGKSPPKKLKLAGQRKSFGPTSSQTEAILCSTPKNGSFEDGRKWIELERITPVRGWPGMSKESRWSKEACGRKGKIIQPEKDQCHYVSKQSIDTELVVEQKKDEQLDLWEMEKNSLLHNSRLTFIGRESEDKTRLNHGTDGGNTEDRKWVELRRQTENHGDTRGEKERLEKSYLPKEKEVDKDKEQHLRRYHQQLQQFRPLSTSSSLHLFSNSFSISPVSTILHSSSPSFSALEDILDSDSPKSENRNKGKPLSSSETIPQHAVTSRNSVEETKEDLSRIYRVGRDERGGRVTFDSSDSERSDKVTGAARVRKEDNTPAEMEIQGRRRAWTNTMTGAISTNATSYVLGNGDLESMVGASSVPSGKAWKQRAADDSELDSAHCSSLSGFKFPAQKAPAERPLSPTHEPTIASLIAMWQSDTEHLHVQKSPESAPSNSQGVNKELSTVNANATTLPLGCKTPSETLWRPSQHPVYHQVPDQEDDDTESQSYTMEPLSVSLLQADQQAATVSFFHRSNCDNSTYLLDKENSENHDSKIEKECYSDMSLEEGDEEFHISLLEMPQSKSRYPPDQRNSLENLPQTHFKLPRKCCSMQNTVIKTNSSNPCSFMTNSGQIVPERADNKTSASMRTSVTERDRVLDEVKTMPHQRYENKSIQLQPTSHVAASDHPTLCNQNDLGQAWWSISVAQWEQLKHMETLSHEEGKLLSRHPDMAFEEYVNRLGEIVEAKVLCVNNLRAQLLPFLKPSKSSKRK